MALKISSSSVLLPNVAYLFHLEPLSHFILRADASTENFP
jgi:hypothetical protein